jgi:DNA-binding transcriptional LysR family regulator
LLRYFVAVAEELNFGWAADRLLIAGPSLSQQIKALELDLGVHLLERDRRSGSLTPAEPALLPDARSLLAGADDLQRRTSHLSGSELPSLDCAPVAGPFISRCSIVSITRTSRGVAFGRPVPSP